MSEQQVYDRMYADWQEAASEAERLRGENLRYRDALERLASSENVAAYEPGYINHELSARIELARAALGASPESERSNNG